MLGSSAEAEDVVQDAWLRWHAADASSMDSTEAWLVSVTTRLAIGMQMPVVEKAID